MKIRTTKRVKSEGREKEKLYFFFIQEGKKKSWSLPFPFSLFFNSHFIIKCYKVWKTRTMPTENKRK